MGYAAGCDRHLTYNVFTFWQVDTTQRKLTLAIGSSCLQCSHRCTHTYHWITSIPDTTILRQCSGIISSVFIFKRTAVCPSQATQLCRQPRPENPEALITRFSSLLPQILGTRGVLKIPFKHQKIPRHSPTKLLISIIQFRGSGFVAIIVESLNFNKSSVPPYGHRISEISPFVMEQ